MYHLSVDLQDGHVVVAHALGQAQHEEVDDIGGLSGIIIIMIIIIMIIIMIIIIILLLLLMNHYR